MSIHSDGYGLFTHLPFSSTSVFPCQDTKAVSKNRTLHFLQNEGSFKDIILCEPTFYVIVRWRDMRIIHNCPHFLRKYVVTKTPILCASPHFYANPSSKDLLSRVGLETYSEPFHSSFTPNSNSSIDYPFVACFVSPNTLYHHA